MEKLVEQAMLYDFYGELLTEHQRCVFEDVVLQDLSLAEVAEEYGISRQGVHDLIKRCMSILNGYERKLHLLEKFLKTKTQVMRIRDLADDEEVMDIDSRLMEIGKIADHILKEL